MATKPSASERGMLAAGAVGGGSGDAAAFSSTLPSAADGGLSAASEVGGGGEDAAAFTSMLRTTSEGGKSAAGGVDGGGDTAASTLTRPTSAKGVKPGVRAVGGVGAVVAKAKGMWRPRAHCGDVGAQQSNTRPGCLSPDLLTPCRPQSSLVRSSATCWTYSAA